MKTHQWLLQGDIDWAVLSYQLLTFLPWVRRHGYLSSVFNPKQDDPLLEKKSLKDKWGLQVAPQQERRQCYRWGHSVQFSSFISSLIAMTHREHSPCSTYSPRHTLGYWQYSVLLFFHRWVGESGLIQHLRFLSYTGSSFSGWIHIISPMKLSCLNYFLFQLPCLDHEVKCYLPISPTYGELLGN